MPATITFKPETVYPDIVRYDIYRSADQTSTGTFNKIGEVAQNVLAPFLSFVDAAGTADDWYKVISVDVGNLESLASNAFKALTDNLTRLFGQVIDGSRRPIVGISVEARLSVMQALVQNEESTISVNPFLQTLTDLRGVWFLDLHPNAILLPSGTEWIVTIQGFDEHRRITLPQQPLVSYSSVVTL